MASIHPKVAAGAAGSGVGAAFGVLTVGILDRLDYGTTSVEAVSIGVILTAGCSFLGGYLKTAPEG